MPYKIKADVEKDVWLDYMAKCARIVTENTACMVKGSFISLEYDDIIRKKPQIKQKQGEATEKIRAKLR